MDRQHNGYRIKTKGQTKSAYTTHNPKDRVTGTPPKTGMNSYAPEGYAVPVPLVTPVVLIL